MLLCKGSTCKCTPQSYFCQGSGKKTRKDYWVETDDDDYANDDDDDDDDGDDDHDTIPF